MSRIAPGIAGLLAMATTALAAPFQFAPYKDELFTYQTILDRAYGGDYLEVDYDRPRDLDARDVVRGKKVDPKYVSLETDAVQVDLKYDAGARPIRYYGVGRVDGGARAIIVFVHGMNTTRATGVDDWIHGGNFNRVKNLAMRNEAVYLSPDFANFGRRGTADVKSLITYNALLSPGAPVFLACGSMGARICWRLMDDPDVAPLLGGLILFDPVMDRDDMRIAASLPPAARVPILITGSREDTVVGWQKQRELFRTMKAQVPDYPIRYVLFSRGTHGLSLRMTDWRETLNWMLTAGGG